MWACLHPFDKLSRSEALQSARDISDARVRLAQQMEALLSWHGVMFLTHFHQCSEACALCKDAVPLRLECILHIYRQTRMSRTPNTHVPPQTHTHMSGFPSHVGVGCVQGVYFFTYLLVFYFWPTGSLVCSITLSIYFPSHAAVSDLTLWLL